MHIALAVAANEIDVDIKDMCAFAFLVLGQRDQAVPVFGIQEIPHLP